MEIAHVSKSRAMDGIRSWIVTYKNEQRVAIILPTENIKRILESQRRAPKCREDWRYYIALYTELNLSEISDDIEIVPASHLGTMAILWRKRNGLQQE